MVGGGGVGCASDGEMPSVWEYYLSDMGNIFQNTKFYENFTN